MSLVAFEIRLTAPQTHYLEVTAVYPTGGRAALELMMPVWTPGSYLVREYARFVEGFRCDAPWRKTAKNRWRLQTEGHESVTVHYRLYAHELTVRTNYVDERFALIIPAATFLVPVERADMRYEIRVAGMPAAWQGGWTGLKQAAPLRYQAESFDELVDCPLYLGSPRVHEFVVDGRPHLLVNEGEDALWDGAAAAAATRKIVEAYGRLMGAYPYERYVFLNLIVEAGGGLEHANSTVLMTSRWAWANEKEPPADPREAAQPSRHAWLDLASHEFFHAWNAKRLRPRELGPFDYEQENYTRSLWVVEGVTSYYGPLMVCRAGLMRREAYLKDLSRTIGQLQMTPGRLAQPLSEASFEAWIQYYRPHENSANASVSYYVKGSVVAWLIDAALRRATQGRRTLDTVMREAYARFSGERGFAYDEFFALLPEIDARPWVEGVGELDYSAALDWFGLRWAAGEGGKRWLGAKLKADLVMESVVTGGPAAGAGLSAGDELLAIGGHRVTRDGLDRILAGVAAETVVLVARRGRLVETPLRLTNEPRHVWALEVDPAATREQGEHLAAWLEGGR